jgi:hypothetical protein
MLVTSAGSGPRWETWKIWPHAKPTSVSFSAKSGVHGSVVATLWSEEGAETNR